MIIMVKISIFAVMDAEKFSLKNHASIRTMFRWETPHTFYRILNY